MRPRDQSAARALNDQLFAEPSAICRDTASDRIGTQTAESELTVADHSRVLRQVLHMGTNFQQVRDILERICGFHRRLRDELEQVRPATRDRRTRFVLESLRRDEQAMSLALAHFRRQAATVPLANWVQFVSDEDTQRLLRETHFRTDMDPDELLAKKLEIDQSLLELYQRLSEQSAAPRVNELFGRLAEQTSQRLNNQSWNNRDSDCAPKQNRDPHTPQ